MEEEKSKIKNSEESKMEKKVVETKVEDIKPVVEKNKEEVNEKSKVVEKSGKGSKVGDKKETKEEKTAEKSKTEDKKKDAGKKESKKGQKPIVKKEEAIANGSNLHFSKKHGMYICEFIKNKTIDGAILDLEKVILKKKIVPFRGEIPHRKGKGMMSGRYPAKGSALIINILKGLKGNAITNGLDLDKTIIYYASANWGVRPSKKGGRRGKRTNILVKAKEKVKEKKK